MSKVNFEIGNNYGVSDFAYIMVDKYNEALCPDCTEGKVVAIIAATKKEVIVECPECKGLGRIHTEDLEPRAVEVLDWTYTYSSAQLTYTVKETDAPSNAKGHIEKQLYMYTKRFVREKQLFRTLELCEKYSKMSKKERDDDALTTESWNDCDDNKNRSRVTEECPF